MVQQLQQQSEFHYQTVELQNWRALCSYNVNCSKASQPSLWAQVWRIYPQRHWKIDQCTLIRWTASLSVFWVFRPWPDSFLALGITSKPCSSATQGDYLVEFRLKSLKLNVKNPTLTWLILSPFYYLLACLLASKWMVLPSSYDHYVLNDDITKMVQVPT